ncbi:MAG TPA: hypothetical protein VEQ63_11750, partial [Bryobacteraceae bacterium]|nr:hypothetical protein [Bryobacteraceae bacterium]
MRSKTFRALAMLTCVAAALAQTGYQKPSKAILDVLNAPPPPVVDLIPSRTHLMLLQGNRYSTVADLSEPVLRIAGIRINPANSGPHNARYFTSLSFQPVSGGPATLVALPQGSRILTPRLTANGLRFAFLNLLRDRIELWTGEVPTGKARRVEGVTINATLGEALQWMPDGNTLLVQLVPPGRGKAPEASTVPSGPVIQESAGRSGPVRTYQDMLGTPHDEALFEYYGTSQLALIDTGAAGSKPRLVGRSALISRSDVSP